MEADRVPLSKDPGNIGTVNILITSPKSVGRNLIYLSGHNYLILIPAPCGNPQVSSSTIPGFSMIVLSREEYERLNQLEFS